LGVNRGRGQAQQNQMAQQAQKHIVGEFGGITDIAEFSRQPALYPAVMDDIQAANAIRRGIGLR